MHSKSSISCYQAFLKFRHTYLRKTIIKFLLFWLLFVWNTTRVAYFFTLHKATTRKKLRKPFNTVGSTIFLRLSLSRQIDIAQVKMQCSKNFSLLFKPGNTTKLSISHSCKQLRGQSSSFFYFAFGSNNISLVAGRGVTTLKVAAAIIS